MSADRVLVAFASLQGSTAGVAETIANELRDAGFHVDCIPVADVIDLEPYGAFVLGSGVFLAGRRSDGGGFIARHAVELQGRPVWLFSAGPIGGAGGAGSASPGAAGANGASPGAAGTGSAIGEAPVVRVARAIGARGAATFGAARLLDPDDARRPTAADWSEAARIRGWAWAIAVELARSGFGGASPQTCPPRPARRPRFSQDRPVAVTR
ncbi:MAG: flavodoxin domain-containing protein [Chloroflexota bacterium]